MAQEIIEEVIKRAGGLRAAARLLNYNLSYLCRVRRGQQKASFYLFHRINEVYPDLKPMILKHIGFGD